MHNDISAFDPKFGMAFGFIGFIVKIYNFILVASETSQTLLTLENFRDSAIMAAWCTVIGLGITWFVNFLQKKWLGAIKKTKKDGK